ncbi:MAG: DUF1189 family protein [Candidatus Paceibacterota bacterium]
MKIFKTIKSAVYDKEFYQNIRSRKLSSVFKYYAKLSLLLSVIGFVLSAIFLVPLAYGTVNFFKSEFTKAYPAGLEVSIQKGIISTNLSTTTEPMLVPLPQIFVGANINKRSESNPYKDVKNLIVLDTKSTTTPSIDNFKSLNTIALVTSKYLITYDKNNSVVFSDVSKYPDFTLNQKLIDKALYYAKYIPIAVPFAIFVLVFFFVFFELFFLLVPALIFFVVNIIIKNRYSFGESYKICVYASTLPVIISATTFFIPMHIPFLFTFLVLLIAIINTKQSEVEETVVVPEDSEIK